MIDMRACSGEDGRARRFYDLNDTLTDKFIRRGIFGQFYDSFGDTKRRC